MAVFLNPGPSLNPILVVSSRSSSSSSSSTSSSSSSTSSRLSESLPM